MDKEDVVRIYNGILLSHEKDKIMPFADIWMDLEIAILSTVSQREKDKHHMMSLNVESEMPFLKHLGEKLVTQLVMTNVIHHFDKVPNA